MKREDLRYVAQTAALLSSRAVNLNLLQSAHVAADDALDLHRIATKLHRWAERNCSEDLTCPVCHGDGTLPRGSGITPAPGRFERRTCRACAGRGNTLGRREARQEKLASDAAAKYGMRVYFQGDCRGCPLYLIPSEATIWENGGHRPMTVKDDDSHYNSRGVAVCHLG